MENRKLRFIGWYQRVAICIFEDGAGNFHCVYDTPDAAAEMEGSALQITLPGVKDDHIYRSAEIAKRETLVYAQNTFPGPFQDHINWHDLFNDPE